MSTKQAMRTLYGASTEESAYVHMRASVYDSRKKHARQRNDLLEVKRLEQEELEITKLCRELRLPEDKALALAVSIRDCGAFGKIAAEKATRAGQQFSPKDKLTQREAEILTERYGEKIADVIASTHTHVGKLLADKPALAETIRDSRAFLDVDCVTLVADAVTALNDAPPTPPAAA